MGIEEILIKDARQEGIEKGSEAVSEKDCQFTKSLLLSTNFDNAKIALLVGVTAEYVSNLRANLS